MLPQKGPQKLIQQQIAQPPQFTTRIVKKILANMPNLQETKAELYDILVQAKESDEPQAYCNWAFATDPEYMINLYNKFGNTDKLDLHELFMTIEAKKREYGAFNAIIPAAGTASGKIIGTREYIKERCTGKFTDSIMSGYEQRVQEFGINNLYEFYLVITPGCFQIVFSVHDNKDSNGGIDEAHDITGYIYPINLKFNSTDHMISFIRKRADSYDTDLQDLIVYE